MAVDILRFDNYEMLRTVRGGGFHRLASQYLQF